MTKNRCVIVAPDKFKGSLSAPRVAEAVARGLREAAPDVDVRLLPVADGGDGTVDAAVAAGFLKVGRWVTGPAGKPVPASFAVRGTTAVVEVASAAGLTLLDEPAPLTATSHGVGELLKAALDVGCTTIVLGLGGSACTDGGAGMLEALGEASFDGVDLVLASDVDNPLLGPSGAAAVYGPQKGASPEQVEILEARLEAFASRVGLEHAGRPGAGAAGGIGFAALAVLGARFRPGIEVVLELAGFSEAVRDARLVITGEGSLDAQTRHGKAPYGVVRASGDVPVVAVAGQCSVEPGDLGLKAAYALLDVEPDITRCMARAESLLTELGGRIARDWVSE
ncbi:glycerate kinase family protein [Lentzea aerocolonigenes]|uniref:glycerate kinase family protein n=1 Tax=Lentzea aerocolonigenes TaxID=68170 RepID=UPI000AC03EA5|nr:glycerate kinase [Lentzea aerocolonigenes]MCP2249314.1 glycerate kinase [Lentzea aerocolonigenes]